MGKYILYKIVKFIGTPIFKLLYRPTILNKDNIPKDGPIVLAGNHTNNYDSPLVIVSTKRVVHFLAKNELHQGKMAWFFKSMATIPVDRKNKDKNAMESSIKVLENNELIGIFPEGTFNRTDDIIMPFKYGAVSMAFKTNAQIVPFSITGKYQLFKKNVVICFDKPYMITNPDLNVENKKLEEKVKKLIIKNIK